MGLFSSFGYSIVSCPHIPMPLPSHRCSLEKTRTRVTINSVSFEIRYAQINSISVNKKFTIRQFTLLLRVVASFSRRGRDDAADNSWLIDFSDNNADTELQRERELRWLWGGSGSHRFRYWCQQSFRSHSHYSQTRIGWNYCSIRISISFIFNLYTREGKSLVLRSFSSSSYYSRHHYPWDWNVAEKGRPCWQIGTGMFCAAGLLLVWACAPL